MANVWDWFVGRGEGATEIADTTKAIREPYMAWLSQQIGKPGETYQGNIVSDLTEQEKESLNYLSQYGQGGLEQNATFQNANKVVNDTLTNKYDPASSPYYQAVKAESARNLADTQRNIESTAGGAGNVWTGGRIKAQGEAATNNALGLNTILGQLAQQERQNQLNIIPQALSMATDVTNEPLAKTAAFQQFGSLPRTVEDAKNEATYNEWIRANVEYPMMIAQLASGSIENPLYQANPTGVIPGLLAGLGSKWLGGGGKASSTTDEEK